MALDMSVAYKIAASVTGQQAVDNLKNSMTGLERAGFSATNAFSALKGAAVGLAAGFSALTVVQQATQAIREEEVAQGRLNGLLRATQFSAGLTAKELGNLADSIEDVAGQFNGEQIRDGISTLLRFGNIGGEVFKEATRLSVDLAAALGTDVSGAAQQVGRALADPVDGLNALRRAGVIFNDVQKEEIKLLVDAGDAAGAQAKVLELLRTRVGGVAQEINQGLNKQIAAADRAYGDFLKTLGNSTVVQGTVATFFDYVTGELEEIDRIVNDGDFLAGLGRLTLVDEIGRFIGGGSKTQRPAPGKSDMEFDPQQQDAILGEALAAQRQEQERLAEAERKRREEAEKAAEAAAKEAEARRKSFDGLIMSMSEEVSKTQELTRVELELQRIALGKYGPLSAANKALLLEKAAQIDAANAQKKVEDEAAKAAEKRRTEAQQAFEATKSEVTRLFEETRTPIEKLNIEMARLDELLAMGAIDFDLYSRAVFKATDEFDNFGKETKTGFEELEDAIRGFGNQATDAIVGFVTGAKISFSGLIDSVLQDLIRLTVQKGITGPLFGALSSAVGGLFGGGLLEFGPTPLANGGVMTGAGSMPLQMYANGGVATSPQVAIFGEGTTPEAFVPLPDGRSIPVTVSGQGGGVNVTVNVSVESGNTQGNGGQDRASNLGRVVAGVVREELLKQKRPGGLLAV